MPHVTNVTRDKYYVIDFSLNARSNGGRQSGDFLVLVQIWAKALSNIYFEEENNITTNCSVVHFCN